MPVDQYTGGVEHAILHLLYSRFFTKVLHDMGLVAFTEPFPRLMNQGQVIYGGASMSQDRRATSSSPMPIVERWGADTMRLIMLFAGPFEDDIDWKLIAAPTRTRRPGVHAWLGRVFTRGRRSRRRAATRAEPESCCAADAPDDQGRDRGPGAVPVQHRDLEAAGADERDAIGARRGRGRA